MKIAGFVVAGLMTGMVWLAPAVQAGGYYDDGYRGHRRSVTHFRYINPWADRHAVYYTGYGHYGRSYALRHRHHAYYGYGHYPRYSYGYRHCR